MIFSKNQQMNSTMYYDFLLFLEEIEDTKKTFRNYLTFIRSNLQVSDETYKNIKVKERSILKVDTVLKLGLIFTH